MFKGLVKRVSSFALAGAGGPARLEVALLLAGALALATADSGAISAVSGRLEHVWRIDNTQIGLLLAAESFATALATLPFGALVDRTRRKTVLTVTIVAWCGVMVVSGFATSYVFMVIARAALGLVAASAWPCVASLTGDFFPARERASIYGLILGGEFVGVGAGFFIAGEVSALLDWRWAFFVLAALSLALAPVIWRYLPEPERGSQAWLRRGETDASVAEHPRQDGDAPRGRDDDAVPEDGPSSTIRRIIRDGDVEPRPELILREDPSRRSLVWAIAYCLRIPTYRLLIAASSLAYYFLAGASALGMIYFTGHYRLGRASTAALIIVLGFGALAGVVGGGRIATWLLERGHLNARIIVPAVALCASVPVLGLGIWTRSVWLGVAMMTIGGAGLSAAVAPIDAARLDVVVPGLWGRAEAGRMLLRSSFQGSAPLVFGGVSQALGADDRALMWTFLIMLTPMLAACVLVLPGRRTYPRDVATAAASVEAIRRARPLKR